ncbi:hypothetical protein N7517_010703 [Penicillium concentricum]|uniref:Uncharacterized protein n=1 Tax=Penicillium concentricum TaxID=293559 RepID=A0A9W9UTK5_9EURO|nr:uncharacterized protein N7517_010703 [Penicillium concentricum]KAJ5356094.1 hypothetical protein N7517_010703 [Penicillium concentricum]
MSEPIYEAEEATIETLPTPDDMRGSYQLVKQRGKEGPTTYNDVVSAEKKQKKRKRKRNDISSLMDQSPERLCVMEMGRPRRRLSGNYFCQKIEQL